MNRMKERGKERTEYVGTITMVLRLHAPPALTKGESGSNWKEEVQVENRKRRNTRKKVRKIKEDIDKTIFVWIASNDE